MIGKADRRALLRFLAWHGSDKTFGPGFPSSLHSEISPFTSRNAFGAGLNAPEPQKSRGSCTHRETETSKANSLHNNCCQTNQLSKFISNVPARAIILNLQRQDL